MFFFIFSFSLFSFLSLDHIQGPRYIKNVSKCREDIHYKTQTGTCCEKCYSKAFRMGFEPASSRLLDQCSTTELQKLLDMTPMACWSVKSLVPRGWNHEWCEYVYYFLINRIFLDFTLFSHSDSYVDICNHCIA